MKTFILSVFDVSKVKEFFNPRFGQVQMFTTSRPVAILLFELGYPPKGMKNREDIDALPADEFYYFEIPDNFRTTQVQKTETVTW